MRDIEPRQGKRRRSLVRKRGTARGAGRDAATRRRLAGRLKRKEDKLLRPFPTIDLMFWGEEWVQKTLDRFLWNRRGGEEDVPGAARRFSRRNPLSGPRRTTPPR